MDNQPNLEAEVEGAWNTACTKMGLQNHRPDLDLMRDLFKLGFAAGGQYALQNAAPFELKREPNNG